MHAPVEALEIGEVAERLGAADEERVEQPHLDILVNVERGEQAVETGNAVVVEQQPHADPPVRRLAQRFQHQHSRQVGAPDVVLHVEAPLGGAGEEDARGEGLMCVREQVDARQAGPRGGLLLDAAAEPRVFCVGQRRALEARFKGRQASEPAHDLSQRFQGRTWPKAPQDANRL